jgi:glutaminase
MPSNDKITDIINRAYETYKDLDRGKLADYIPELGKADIKNFGISVTTVKGETISVGNADTMFSIQSISKPFVFGMALEGHGTAHVRSRVGVEPTGEPFHSIIRLQAKSKRPSNPLVNAGAIAMTDLVNGNSHEERIQNLQSALAKYTGRPLDMDESVYLSEKATGHRNRATAHLMLHFGMVEPRIDETTDLYFRQCSYKITSDDLSVMAATLANNGINPKSQDRALLSEHVKSLLTLMFTCGLYTYAGEWAFRVGIPAKSGVSGGILGVVPGVMGIGVYSPLVDKHGNSVRGIRVFKNLATELGLHMFSHSIRKSP